ncbi:MAG: phytoene desaturase [Polyangiales bacterium]
MFWPYANVVFERLLPSGRLIDPQRLPLQTGADAPHALVIGAGFGGLAAAIRLGVRGYRVTVVDRLDQAGGRARVFRQDGFVFDAGPTLVTAPFLFEELWTICGKRMEDYIDMRSVLPFYRIRFDDGDVFEYTGDAKSMEAEVAKIEPSDVDGYRRFVAKSEDIFKTGFERLAHVPFETAADMLRVAPSMIKLESYLTVASLVAKFIKNPKLRQVFSFHPLLVGGNPYNTTSIYTLIAFLERKWGVWFPMGGTGALVQGMVDLIEGLGGTVRLSTDVEEIEIEAQSGSKRKAKATGIRLKGGERIAADIVVSNADSSYMYKHMIAAEHRKTWTDRKLERSDSSMSLFVWYFGTKKRYEDVAHHTILLGPRYKELLTDIFDRKILSDDFSLYLHRPTATDPGLAPEGCDGFYVLSPVPHLESGTDWSTEAERYRALISKHLSDTIMPGLEENLVTSRVLTPQDFKDDYLSFRGAAFGIQPKLTQSAFFRPHNASEDIDGLYLVGAGTHPGAGMPGVLSTARVLDSIVPDP